MEIIALVVLILTALLGGYLLSYVQFNKNTPKGIAIMHGSLGALGIVLLAVSGLNLWLVLFFCLVALGGIVLITLDITGRKIPHALAFGHGLLALAGIGLLIYVLFFMTQ